VVDNSTFWVLASSRVERSPKQNRCEVAVFLRNEPHRRLWTERTSSIVEFHRRERWRTRCTPSEAGKAEALRAGRDVFAKRTQFLFSTSPRPEAKWGQITRQMNHSWKNSRPEGWGGSQFLSWSGISPSRPSFAVVMSAVIETAARFRCDLEITLTGSLFSCEAPPDRRLAARRVAESARVTLGAIDSAHAGSGSM
jgi:hypothetical protein